MKNLDFTPIGITKKIASFVVGTGTSKIVAGIVANNTRPKNAFDYVTIAVASAVVGYMAADKSSEYTDQKIDEAIDWFRATKLENEKEKKELPQES